MKTCTQEDCGRTRYCRGLCIGHYRRLQKGQPLDGPIAPKRKHRRGLCEAGTCSNAVLAAGLCRRHYWRKREGREDWDAPLRPRRKDTVPLGGVRLKRTTAEALARRAKASGLSTHAMAVAVLETWHATIAVDVERWRRGA